MLEADYTADWRDGKGRQTCNTAGFRKIEKWTMERREGKTDDRRSRNMEG